MVRWHSSCRPDRRTPAGIEAIGRSLGANNQLGEGWRPAPVRHVPAERPSAEKTRPCLAPGWLINAPSRINLCRPLQAVSGQQTAMVDRASAGEAHLCVICQRFSPASRAGSMLSEPGFLRIIASMLAKVSNC